MSTFIFCISTNPGTDRCSSTKFGGFKEGATGGRPIVSIGRMGITLSGGNSISGLSTIGIGLMMAGGTGRVRSSSGTISGTSTGIGAGWGKGSGAGTGIGSGLGSGRGNGEGVGKGIG